MGEGNTMFKIRIKKNLKQGSLTSNDEALEWG